MIAEKTTARTAYSKNANEAIKFALKAVQEMLMVIYRLKYKRLELTDKRTRPEDDDGKEGEILVFS